MDCLNDCETGYLYGFKIYAKTTTDDEEENEQQVGINQTEETQTVPETQQSQMYTQNTQNETQMSQQNISIQQTQSQKPEVKRKRGRPRKNESKLPSKNNHKKPNKSTKYNYQYSMPNGQIAKTVHYLLKDLAPNDQNQPNNVIIGMDNYYTTGEVIRYLIDKGFGFCGTVRVLRNYIPAKLKELELEKHQSVHISNGNITMTNYKAKEKKNVFLISNLIRRFRRCKRNNLKPEIVLIYNMLKGATDRYDHILSNCDLRRKANRFQLAVFYDMLNVLVTDCFVIKRMSSNKLDHRQFVTDLGLKLLGVNCQENPSTLCCEHIPTNVHCKLTKHFFITRTTFPSGKRHIEKSIQSICNQCGKPVTTGNLQRVVFCYCHGCFNELSFPETFHTYSPKRKNNK